MPEIYAAAERTISAPAHEVYAYIADHRQHHPHFLPDAFSDYRVEEGGVGAGTVVAYSLKVGGKKYPARAHIAEPEPGRVISETVDSGYLTTFTVLPLGAACHVRIETRAQLSGIRGLIERLFVPGVLRRLFTDELERLDAYACAQAESVPAVAESTAR